MGETTLTLPTDGAPGRGLVPGHQGERRREARGHVRRRHLAAAALKKLIPAGFSVTYPSGGVRGVAVAPGRYPLVVFSHGYAGFRDQSTFLTSFLASWGFVVAAPDHYSRDLTEVLGGPTGATAKTTDVGTSRRPSRSWPTRTRARRSPFHGHVDTRRVGAVGHSAGGAAVEALAATDPKVATFIGLAGATVGSSATPSTAPAASCPRSPACSCPAPPTPWCPPPA